jgi:hypothetical protein
MGKVATFCIQAIIMISKKFCLYYQAHVSREVVWFMVATLRSFEHVAFDRTFSTSESIFEFFVPERNEHIFLELMDYYTQHNIVHSVQKLPNRLEDPLQQL